MRKYFKFFFNFFFRIILKKTSLLKDSRIGESCYIFGDGVSLKWFNLKNFSDKKVIALSYIFFHKDSSNLNYDLGLLTEPYYFYKYFKLPWEPKTFWRNKIQEKFRKIIKFHDKVSFVVNLSCYPVLRGKNVYYVYKTLNDFKFANECLENGESIYGGSLKVAISLAIYMGYSEVILVGCDYTHEISKSKHWYEYGEGVDKDHPNYLEKFFTIAQKYIKIKTITLKGKGSVLPSITYEDYTGQKPRYIENFALVDHSTLSLLNTWPDYQIFPENV
jgi:hypothetical protein